MTTSPIISVAAFLKRHLPGLRPWPRETLLPYVEWYWRDARVGVVRDGPRILAVALARCIDDPAQAKQTYHHDEHGRLVWVEHIASTHPQGVALLLQIAMQRFGPREAFAGDVFKREGELRMLPWRTVERLTAGIPHEFNQSPRTTAAA